jgi:D-amino-acid dehydrogenase
VALHLAKRGLSVALLDRRGPGEETSYGNTGVIVGASVFPTGFPRSMTKLLQVAMKRAPEANYHWGDLLKIAPWLIAYYGFSTTEKLKDSAVKLRPLMSRSVAEHKLLLEESGALKYLRENGWLTLYRTDAAFAAMQPQLEFGATIGVAAQALDTEQARALEPSLAPVFRHALMWPDVASLSNPLMVTRAYATRFSALGGTVMKGDARTLRRADGRWCVDTDTGPVEAAEAIVALGPWSSDVLEPLGIKVPLGIKRGYHRHYAAEGQAPR